MSNLKKLPARFFISDSGNEPVREWQKGLKEKDRRLVGTDIATAEYGWPVGMPKSRSLGQGLFEIRSNLTGSRISRVIFTVSDNEMLLLHGFIKKTQKTPKKDIDLALGRLKRIS
jgi:phage-related protein